MQRFLFKTMMFTAAAVAASGLTSCVELGPFVGVRAGYSADCERVAVIWKESASGALEATEVPCSSIGDEGDHPMRQACDFDLAPPARCMGGADGGAEVGTDAGPDTALPDAVGDTMPDSVRDGSDDVAEVDDTGPDMADIQQEVDASDGKDTTEVTTCQGNSDCDDLDTPCQDAGCVSGVCEVLDKEDGTSCDDAAPCTINDMCSSGECIGSPLACISSGECVETSTCDPATGACVDEFKVDGTDCDDEDVCTTSHECNTGVCVGSGKPTDSGDWFRQIAGEGQVTVREVLTFSNGNIGVVGEFNAPSIYVGDAVGNTPQNLYLPSGATVAAFVAEYAPNGDVESASILAWSDLALTVRPFPTGKTNEVRFGGTFQGTLYYGPTGSPSSTTVGAGFDQAIFLKDGQSSSLALVGSFNSPSEQFFVSDISSAGTYLAGFGSGLLSLDTGNGEPTVIPADQGYVVKVDGPVVWTHLFDGAVLPTSIARHPESGAVSVGGLFSDAVDFAPSLGGPLTAKHDLDQFVVRFQGSGAVSWVRAIGTTTCEGESEVRLLPMPAEGVVLAGRLCPAVSVSQPGASNLAIPFPGGNQPTQFSGYAALRFSGTGVVLNSLPVSGTDENSAIVVDRIKLTPSGQIQLTGFVSQPTTIGTEILSQFSDERIYLIDMSPTLDVNWTADVGGDIELYPYVAGPRVLGLAPFGAGSALALSFETQQYLGSDNTFGVTPTNATRDGVVFTVNTSNGLSCQRPRKRLCLRAPDLPGSSTLQPSR